jgi:hypothetical protein
VPNHKLSSNKPSLLSLNTNSHVFSPSSVGVIADETWTLINAAPASCEIRAVIGFLYAEGQSTAEIRQLCRAYGDNVMSDSCVREWCRKFEDGRTDEHEKRAQGQYSIVTDELIH